MTFERKVRTGIDLYSDKLLTDTDHPIVDCLTESEFLTHYGQFYYMRKDYDRSGEKIKPILVKTPCVNWMMATRFFQMADKEYPLRYKGNPPFDYVVNLEGSAYDYMYPHEGFYHRCKDVWGGSWYERWAYLTIRREESNLDLWFVQASGNDDMSYGIHILGEENAVNFFEQLKTMPYNTITPEWCGQNGWFFTN